MKIILLGAPGSGKGTQSQFITKEYGINKISTGDILRSYIKKNKNIGKKIKNIIEKGKLVPDELIISIIKKEIKKDNFQKNFLLEGFPRNINQAITLKKSGIIIDHVIELLSSNNIIINRLNGRMIHLASGRIYHKKYCPPKIKNKDDITGEPLVKRSDDKIDIIKLRLKEYADLIKPIVLFYKKEAEYNSLIYNEINVNKSIIDINKKLKTILG